VGSRNSWQHATPTSLPVKQVFKVRLANREKPLQPGSTTARRAGLHRCSTCRASPVMDVTRSQGQQLCRRLGSRRSLVITGMAGWLPPQLAKRDRCSIERSFELEYLLANRFQLVAEPPGEQRRWRQGIDETLKDVLFERREGHDVRSLHGWGHGIGYENGARETVIARSRLPCGRPCPVCGHRNHNSRV
jgi:hypothetical protein